MKRSVLILTFFIMIVFGANAQEKRVQAKWQPYAPGVGTADTSVTHFRIYDLDSLVIMAEPEVDKISCSFKINPDRAMYRFAMKAVNPVMESKTFGNIVTYFPKTGSTVIDSILWNPVAPSLFSVADVDINGTVSIEMALGHYDSFIMVVENQTDMFLKDIHLTFKNKMVDFIEPVETFPYLGTDNDKNKAYEVWIKVNLKSGESIDLTGDLDPNDGDGTATVEFIFEQLVIFSEITPTVIAGMFGCWVEL